MVYFRKDDYTKERERPRVLTPYLQSMTTYLERLHPHVSPETIDAFVKQTITKHIKNPEVEAVVHKSEGNSDLVRGRLDHYIRDHIKDNNFSPSGTSYMRVSQRESFIRISIRGKVKARDDYKHQMFSYQAQGMKRETQYFNLQQANTKIFNNAIAGGMIVEQFILGCKAGFNAITSAGRLSVKQAYSFIERAVTGNLYLPHIQAAISYILIHTNAIPDDFKGLAGSRIYLPTHQDLFDYLLKNVLYYTRNPDPKPLSDLISTLTDDERAYVFYAGCFSNLCRFNDQFMKDWIDSCFLTGPIPQDKIDAVDVADLKKFPGDVITCILSTNYERLGKNEKGRWNTTKEAATLNPEGLKEFVYCCHHFVQQFQSFMDVLKPIFRVNTSFTKMVFQHRMARKSVHLSDTDSNIFSTQDLVRWKLGELNFSPKAYQMNAMVTFLLSQSLEHVFARLSAGFGAEGKDVFLIIMKNEFLYPVLIATALGKHYIAIATMQEGAVLPTPRKDIKGVGFRSSTYPQLVTKGFEDYVVKLEEVIRIGKPIRAASVLAQVAKVERDIYESIMNRDSDYLQTVSVKHKEEYADASASQYFYYELWNEVFRDEFGDMVIPNKCFKIPLKGGKKPLHSEAFQEPLKKDYPHTYEKLMMFLDRIGKRDVSYLLIPPFKGKVHPFFVGVMDIRCHIAQVMTGYYHLLNAFEIGTGDTCVDALVSDYLDPSIPLLE